MSPRITVRAEGAGYVVEVTEYRSGGGVTRTAYKSRSKIKAAGVGEFLAGYGQGDLSMFGRLVTSGKDAA